MNCSRLLSLSVAVAAAGLTIYAGEEAWMLETPTGALHGTLLVPDEGGPVPVVFIHPGSGPTDRDGNNAVLGGRNDSLKQLAEGLAQAGIASLRIDKRAIAASRAAAVREEDLRFETYAGDAAAWARLLRESGRFDRLVLCGHSEGALVVSLAAKAVEPDAVILISGSGRPAAEVVRGQLAGKLPPPLADAAEKILTGLERGEQTDEVPPPLATLFRPSVQPYLISWFKHNPVAVVEALKCPVLVIQGETDLQVKPDDARLLAGARSGVRLVLLDGVNHVLKSVSGDMPAQLGSYRSPEPRVDPRVGEAVAGFIRDFSDM